MFSGLVAKERINGPTPCDPPRNAQALKDACSFVRKQWLPRTQIFHGPIVTQRVRSLLPKQNPSIRTAGVASSTLVSRSNLNM